MASRSTGEHSSIREIIIKEGFLKHRETGFVNRWRHRYVVFKITSGGRLSFAVYKDQPATPSNEVAEVPIEDFGGLDVNKLDGEKLAFAIITTDVTECFAADNSDTLLEWRNIIEDYLGKELVINISIPTKQNMLKAGKAQLRIRNTGFTITSTDAPPKCQGSWQILHIRKFGGSDAFRFETGTKCPSGQYLYVIHSDDNERLRHLFTDLSLHKPIFTDRTGRRMTKEQSILRQMNGHRKVSTRHSLEQPMYENQTKALPTRRKSTQTIDSRSRSNAVNELPNEMHSSRLISHASVEYYNVQDSESVSWATVGRTRPMQSSTSSNEPVYYNDAAVLQHQLCRKSVKESKCQIDDSGDESEDDHVDVATVNPALSPGKNEYYNVRQAIFNHRNKNIEQKQTSLSNYENFNPMIVKDTIHTTNSDNPHHLYTNMSALLEEREHGVVAQASTVIVYSDQSTCDTVLNGSVASPVELTPNYTLVNGMNVYNDQGERGSHSDSECTASGGILDKCLESSNMTHSCDDLSYSSWNCSEVEEKNSDLEIVGNNVMETPISSDSRLKKRPITDNYDHLEIRKQPSSDSEDYTPVTDIPPTHTLSRSSTTSRYSGSSLSSTHSAHSFTHDQIQCQEVIEETHKNEVQTKNRMIRRPHIYEDVDVIEDNRRSTSSSPETLERVKQELRYNRKIDLLGHEHNYEYVTSASTNNKDNSSRSATSSPEVLSEWKQRDRSFCVSPNRATRLPHRQPVCTAERIDDFPKPNRSIPVPSIMTKHSNDRPPSVPPKPSRIENSSQTLMLSEYSIPSLPPRLPRRSIDETKPNKGLPLPPREEASNITVQLTSSREHFGNISERKPSLPPRQPSLPMKQAIKDSEPLQNYTEVCIPVSTQRINSSKDDKLNFASRRKGNNMKCQEVNYAEINHLVTLQLEHMKRERDLQKSLI